MDRTKDVIYKGNPLRAGISWQFIAAEGAVAIAIGLYSLLAEASAQKNIVFLIALVLLGNGIYYAATSLRSGGLIDKRAQFRLIRAGIGISTGLLVVINRFVDFMGINPARVVLGIGLVGIGVVTLAGLVVTREESEIRIGAVVTAMLLTFWGLVTLYQASQDSSATRFFGWATLIIGIALLGFAFFRYQRTQAPATAST